jgi:AAA domain-containing protein/bifunctional DNA primase/polymerase-like protein
MTAIADTGPITGSSIAASRTTEQVQSWREDWIKQGHDPAKFDTAHKVDGVEPPPPAIDPVVARHHADHGIPIDPKPADYAGVRFAQLRPDLDTSKLLGVSQATQAFAAGLKIDPTIGKALIERVVELGAKLSAMQPAERETWVAAQEEALLKHAGSEEALAQLRKDAREALTIGGENDISKGLATGIGVLDPWVTRTLGGGSHLYFAGSLPSTVAKLGAGLDTRGIGGYVLVPPSVVDGKPYAVEEDTDLAELPSWVSDLVSAKHAKLAAPDDVVLDTPYNIKRAEHYLRGLPKAVEKGGADAHTYAAAAMLRELGISDGKAFEMLTGPLDRITPRDHRFEAFITRKILNAYKYGQNDAGASGISRPTSEVFAPALAKITAQAANDSSGSGLITRRASEIEMQMIEWLWLNRIPRGKCSLLAGDPKLGKTTALLDMAARVSRGARWPNGEGKAPKGSVIYFSAEDDAGDTLVPRLTAASADLAKIHIAEAVKDADGKGNRTFNLQADLVRLEHFIMEIGDVLLVIFDPISSYFGRTDTYRNSEVRGVLEPLVKMAARLGIAIIGNTHLAKGSKGRANMRILDSVAMTAAVRSVYMVTEDADDSRQRLFLPSGGNLGPPVDGLSFTISSKVVDVSKGITGSHVVWGASVTMSADEALAAMDDKIRKPTAVDEAAQFLNSYLAAGPKSSAEVFDAGENSGHARITMRRAAKVLGIKVDKMDMDAGWIMSLPKT